MIFKGDLRSFSESVDRAKRGLKRVHVNYNSPTVFDCWTLAYYEWKRLNVHLCACSKTQQSYCTKKIGQNGLQMAILSSDLRGLKASLFSITVPWLVSANVFINSTIELFVRIVFFETDWTQWVFVFVSMSHILYYALFIYFLDKVTDIRHLVLFLGLFWSSDHINGRIESQKQPTQSISIHTCLHTQSQLDFCCHSVICKTQCKCSLH